VGGRGGGGGGGRGSEIKLFLFEDGTELGGHDTPFFVGE
jgi:hypothetical protein